MARDALPLRGPRRAVVFTLTPCRMDHGMEFQTEMAFGISLALYARVRLLETRRARDVVIVPAVWLQATAV